MHRPVKLQRLLVLGLIGPIAALNVWLLSQVFRYFEHLITLLVVAAILAFLLNYPVRLFQYLRLSRAQSVTVVLLATFAVLVLAGLTLVPLVTIQTTQLVSKIPEWLEASRQNLDTFDFWARGHNLPLDLRGFSGRINTQIESQLQTLASQAVGLALGTLSGVIDTVLVLVLAFYMLLYGGRLWQGLINLLPPQIGIPLSESLRLNFQNFFITQILLAIFMAIALIPIFVWMQVPFALLFAILIGISELIPFIGAALGISLVALVVMLQNPGLGFQVGIAATVLHQIRDNILAPRMMGDFIGLNPIWIVIALLVGLQIAGFLGVVVAVPLAGTIKGTLEVILGIQSRSQAGKEPMPEPPLGGRGDEG
jgi:predicted PurR-regulated permease PerM